MDETLRSYLGLPHSAETTKLYRNLGNGTFKDVTAEVGLDKVFIPMGANFGGADKFRMSISPLAGPSTEI